jgi:L,D-transpeptidase ErfK/SrfK
MKTKHLLSFGAALCLTAFQPALATTYALDKNDVVGKTIDYTIQSGDTYYTIARKHDLGLAAILAANPGINPETAGPGTQLVLPTVHVLPELPHQGIVINLAELRLYYFPSTDQVMTFPIGTGKDGWETLTGTTKVAQKIKDPVWVVPKSILAENPKLPDHIGPGPNDPLGAFALQLGWPGYLVHGTDEPNSIGLRQSHGCVRLYPEDIEKLFNAVNVGTPVTVIDTFFKLGWKGNQLMLEVYPTQKQTLAISQLQKPDPANFADLYAAVRWQEHNGLHIDWDTVQKATFDHDGVPVPIAERAGALD